MRIPRGGRSPNALLYRTAFTRCQVEADSPNPRPYAQLSSPELAPALGDLSHVERARLFHLLGSGGRSISKSARGPDGRPGWPQKVSQD